MTDELLDRCLPMMLPIALRELEDEHLAEMAAERTFADLQMADVGSQSVLSWISNRHVGHIAAAERDRTLTSILMSFDVPKCDHGEFRKLVYDGRIVDFEFGERLRTIYRTCFDALLAWVSEPLMEETWEARLQSAA